MTTLIAATEEAPTAGAKVAAKLVPLDGVVPVAYAEAYRQMIPGATLVVIPEAGHLPHIEQPDVVLQHVLAFVAR